MVREPPCYSQSVLFCFCFGGHLEMILFLIFDNFEVYNIT